ncbi:DUF4123 domain-containing protein [Paracoccus caeni]|uniref:DUF4123 domain-containing protein n=1 Tax=Paracoccus caeni TaxID=657651 RepID=A0A934VZ56_9RHOB|nr:DUF4123 domain-containing protein [Paracoccus caeni]MBK4216707.1 DUF4123 domain-containing protein [Paracoccus caeni]
MLSQFPEADDPWRVTSSASDHSDVLSAGRVQQQQAPYRTLQVTPLDQQLGQWPRKSVPDALRDTILGVDGRQGFAVLDAAAISNLDQRLQGRRPASVCLFDGDAAVQLGAVAPWLIELADEDALTRSLFTCGPSDRWLWDSGAVIFLRSDLGIDGVRRRLRKLTQVRDEAGDAARWMFLRFWNPVFARYLLDHGSHAVCARLLAAGTIMIPDAPHGILRIWAASQADAARLEAGPLVLSLQDRHALQLAVMDGFVARVRKWLTDSYGRLPSHIDEHRFLVELFHHARNQLGLRSEREVSDYLAASWLLRQPVERVVDMRPLSHEIPQATLARMHDTAWEMSRKANSETA